MAKPSSTVSIAVENSPPNLRSPARPPTISNQTDGTPNTSRTMDSQETLKSTPGHSRRRVLATAPPDADEVTVFHEGAPEANAGNPGSSTSNVVNEISGLLDSRVSEGQSGESTWIQFQYLRQERRQSTDTPSLSSNTHRIPTPGASMSILSKHPSSILVEDGMRTPRAASQDSNDTAASDHGLNGHAKHGSARAAIAVDPLPSVHVVKGCPARRTKPLGIVVHRCTRIEASYSESEGRFCAVVGREIFTRVVNPTQRSTTIVATGSVTRTSLERQAGEVQSSVSTVHESESALNSIGRRASASPGTFEASTRSSTLKPVSDEDEEEAAPMSLELVQPTAARLHVAVSPPKVRVEVATSAQRDSSIFTSSFSSFSSTSRDSVTEGPAAADQTAMGDDATQDILDAIGGCAQVTPERVAQPPTLSPSGSETPGGNKKRRSLTAVCAPEADEVSTYSGATSPERNTDVTLIKSDSDESRKVTSDSTAASDLMERRTGEAVQLSTPSQDYPLPLQHTETFAPEPVQEPTSAHEVESVHVIREEGKEAALHAEQIVPPPLTANVEIEKTVSAPVLNNEIGNAENDAEKMLSNKNTFKSTSTRSFSTVTEDDDEEEPLPVSTVSVAHHFDEPIQQTEEAIVAITSEPSRHHFESSGKNEPLPVIDVPPARKESASALPPPPLVVAQEEEILQEKPVEPMAKETKTPQPPPAHATPAVPRPLLPAAAQRKPRSNARTRSGASPAHADGRRKRSLTPRKSSQFVIPTYNDEWIGKATVDDWNSGYNAMLRKRKLDRVTNLQKRLARAKSRSTAIRRKLNGEPQEAPSPSSARDVHSSRDRPIDAAGSDSSSGDEERLDALALLKEENKQLEKQLFDLRREYGRSSNPSGLIKVLLHQADLQVKAKRKEVSLAEREIKRAQEKLQHQHRRASHAETPASPAQNAEEARTPTTEEAISRRIARLEKKLQKLESSNAADEQEIRSLELLLGQRGGNGSNSKEHTALLMAKERNDQLITKLMEGISVLSPSVNVRDLRRMKIAQMELENGGHAADEVNNALGGAEGAAGNAHEAASEEPRRVMMRRIAELESAIAVQKAAIGEARVLKEQEGREAALHSYPPEEDNVAPVDRNAPFIPRVPECPPARPLGQIRGMSGALRGRRTSREYDKPWLPRKNALSPRSPSKANRTPSSRAPSTRRQSYPNAGNILSPSADENDHGPTSTKANGKTSARRNGVVRRSTLPEVQTALHMAGLAGSPYLNGVRGGAAAGGTRRPSDPLPIIPREIAGGDRAFNRRASRGQLGNRSRDASKIRAEGNEEVRARANQAPSSEPGADVRHPMRRSILNGDQIEGTKFASVPPTPQPIKENQQRIVPPKLSKSTLEAVQRELFGEQ